ncbi:SPX domain-containing protein [Mycena floridula]|nr:SPX domain-containing protein [Mycena floridula]
MKFARYLQDTQIPEWKRAYIDYRGLKKRISAIRKASEITESMSQEDLPQVQSHNEARTPSPVENAPGPSHLGVATSTSSWHAREPLSPGTTSIRSKILKKASWSLPKSPANNPRHPFTAPLSMPELLPLLSQQELDFFTALDAELEKIESFYLDREGEMADRTKTLEAQFQELSVHQQRFQALYAGQARPWFLRKLRWNAFAPKQTKTLPENLRRENVHSDPSALRLFLDQEEYQTAKKQLKKAVVEHYRGLEALKNYRILNITGIRKALKKFEKTTKIPALQSYMSEKVDTSAFALDTTLNILMKTMEDMYASRFVRGDRKRAMARLRVGPQQRKTHHASAFRAGMLFGTACPAFAAGLYQSFQVETRQSISGWDTLLFIYGILSIPVLFSCLLAVGWITGNTSNYQASFCAHSVILSGWHFLE